jgi:hypothetical protein
MTCSALDTSYGGDGMVCANGGCKPELAAPPAPQCYKDRECCEGAPEYPSVPYAGCCKGPCNLPDSTFGCYGKLCSTQYI